MNLQRHTLNGIGHLVPPSLAVGLCPDREIHCHWDFPGWLLSLPQCQPARGRSTAKSYIRKKGQWEREWTEPVPELWLQQCRRSQWVFRGSVINFPPPLLVPQKLTWKAELSLYLSRGNSAQANRTPELCWATASNFQAFSPADYSDMMSFLLRQD